MTNFDPLATPPGQAWPPAPKPETSALAVASLVLGIVAITIGWVIPGASAIGSILAVIFGHIALSYTDARRPDHKSGRGLAIAGLVLGYIVVALIAIVVLWVVAYEFGL